MGCPLHSPKSTNDRPHFIELLIPNYLGWEGDGFNCNDINECEEGLHNCASNADCNNDDGGFTCGCATGFENKEMVFGIDDGTQCIGMKEDLKVL